jgi:hypothetical protein
MTTAPHRRYVLAVNIGADSVDDLEGALEQLLFDIRDRTRDEPATATRLLDSQCGGPRYGWVASLDLDPEVTHDSYFADLRRHLAEAKTPAVRDPGDEHDG